MIKGISVNANFGHKHLEAHATKNGFYVLIYFLLFLL